MTSQTFLDILKYTIPALIVLIATTIIVQKFLINETRKKQLAIFQEGQQTTLRLRLQAYERLTLFLSRIHPREIITRVYQPGMTCRDLQVMLVQSIRSEFEHNLSQQIYVSNEVWKTVQSVKEQEMAMINQIASRINPEASAKELHQKIMDYVLTREQEIPVEIGLEVINNEARLVLQQV
jgi:hypothetical protein